MTIELHDATNGDGLFDVQGKAFHALGTLLTSIGTTVPTEIADILTAFYLRADADTLAVADSMEGLPGAVTTWQATALATQIRTNMEQLLTELVAIDAGAATKSITETLAYLIDQMETAGAYVSANTISLTLTAAEGNQGDLVIAYTERRGDGQVQQHVLPETMTLEATTTAGKVLFEGEAAQSDRLSHTWPGGSGAAVSIAPATSLVANGGFESVTNNVPDNWIVQVGTPGTTVKVTAIEEQTVAIADATAGTYHLSWTNAASVTRSTAPLAYNAAGTAVQAALRAIPGLEAVEVTSTGTSPNFTHTVKMLGVAGDPAQLTSVNHLTGGTITHATTVAGTAGAYRGRALQLASNGTELSAIYQTLTGLSSDRVYFAALRLRRSGTAAAGEIRVEVVDGIGGSVTQDSAGNANALVIDATAIPTDSHQAKWFAFRIPPTVAMPCYLRIRIATAIDSGCSVYLDEVAIAPGTSLYKGGPYAAVFAGVKAPATSDTWTLAVANDRSAVLQDWYNRVFGLADRELLLPVSGTTSIPDSVVS
jgi:hypothetical protein